MRLYHSKRVNYCYILEQCAINLEIPLTPPFSKGESPFSPLCKRGVKGDFIEIESIRLYQFLIDNEPK